MKLVLIDRPPIDPLIIYPEAATRKHLRRKRAARSERRLYNPYRLSRSVVSWLSVAQVLSNILFCNVLALWICTEFPASVNCGADFTVLRAVEKLNLTNGFLSIDAGNAVGQFVTSSGILWLPDSFYDSGFDSQIDNLPYGIPSYDSMETTLRYFPRGQKNCYNVTGLAEGGRYLVRLTFWYSNYDGRNTPPAFNISLGLTVVDQVIMSSYGLLTLESILTLPDSSSFLPICFIRLVNSPSVNFNNPIVNGLEFRPLPPSSYSSSLLKRDVLSLWWRLTCGFTGDQAQSNVRYPADPLDRVWEPDNPDFAYGSGYAISPLETIVAGTNDSVVVTDGNPNSVPGSLFQKVTSIPFANESLVYSFFDVNRPAIYHIYLYFSDLSFPDFAPPISYEPTLNSAGCVFSIYINGKIFFRDFDPYLSAGSRLNAGKTVRIVTQITGANIVVRLEPSAHASVPPMVSGIEIYQRVKTPVATSQREIDALLFLLGSLSFPPPLSDWSGDPCYPVEWAGVSCFKSNQKTYISGLILNNLGLEGDLSPAIGQLFHLRTLLLNGNKLTGSLPDSIGRLFFLKTLNVANNFFSGHVPGSLGDLNLKLFYLSNNNFTGDFPFDDPNSIDVQASGNPFLCSNLSLFSLPLCNSSDLPVLTPSVNDSGLLTTGKRPGEDEPQKSSGSSQGNSKSSGTDLALVIGVIVAIVIAVVAILSVFFTCSYLLQRERERAREREAGGGERSGGTSREWSKRKEFISFLFSSFVERESERRKRESGRTGEGGAFSGSGAGRSSDPLYIRKKSFQTNPPSSVALSGARLGATVDPRLILQSESILSDDCSVVPVEVPKSQNDDVAIGGAPERDARGGDGENGREGVGFPNGPVQVFKLDELEQATNKFALANKIGSGGFGSVFKGTLRDGTLVAIKKRSKDSAQGEKEFHNEVDLLSCVHHFHLVNLIGFCNERGSQILVYEYMWNGTVREHLYDPLGNPYGRLRWLHRLNIAIGAARGIEYLHTAIRPCIIHRDIKTSNILLNEKLEAKVADFGLSKLGPTAAMGETHVSTDVKGTAGYLDPEYYTVQQLTDRSDVFSFGVVLLELVSGRQPINLDRPRAEWSIIDWARDHLQQGDVLSIVDPSLSPSEFLLDSLWKVAEVGMISVEPRACNRPSISDVLLELTDALKMELTLNPMYQEQKRQLLLNHQLNPRPPKSKDDSASPNRTPNRTGSVPNRTSSVGAMANSYGGGSLGGVVPSRMTGSLQSSPYHPYISPSPMIAVGKTKPADGWAASEPPASRLDSRQAVYDSGVSGDIGSASEIGNSFVQRPEYAILGSGTENGTEVGIDSDFSRNSAAISAQGVLTDQEKAWERERNFFAARYGSLLNGTDLGMGNVDPGRDPVSSVGSSPYRGPISGSTWGPNSGPYLGSYPDPNSGLGTDSRFCTRQGEPEEEGYYPGNSSVGESSGTSSSQSSFALSSTGFESQKVSDNSVKNEDDLVSEQFGSGPSPLPSLPPRERKGDGGGNIRGEAAASGGFSGETTGRGNQQRRNREQERLGMQQEGGHGRNQGRGVSGSGIPGLGNIGSGLEIMSDIEMGSVYNHSSDPYNQAAGTGVGARFGIHGPSLLGLGRAPHSYGGSGEGNEVSIGSRENGLGPESSATRSGNSNVAFSEMGSGGGSEMF